MGMPTDPYNRHIWLTRREQPRDDDDNVYARPACAESRIKLRPVGSDRVAVAALTGPTSLDLLGDPSRPATVTNCYRVHREAAANWEVIEATDAQLAQLHAAGYTGLRDARSESLPLPAS